MEADWEVEIGGDAPVIDAVWPGFIDLRRFPSCIAELSEPRELPALADALLRLNAPSPPVWTAKCDVWQPEEFDPIELDAGPDESLQALACYVDLLPRSDQQWNPAARAVAACEFICSELHERTVRACRADLIVRRAIVAPDGLDLGITAYLTACGHDPAHARTRLGSALVVLVDSVCSLHPAAPNQSQIQ